MPTTDEPIQIRRGDLQGQALACYIPRRGRGARHSPASRGGDGCLRGDAGSDGGDRGPAHRGAAAYRRQAGGADPPSLSPTANHHTRSPANRRGFVDSAGGGPCRPTLT